MPGALSETAPFEDLMDLVAMLPWWAGAGLALDLYLLLHSMASPPVVAAPKAGQMGEFVSQIMWQAIATFG